jgi:aerobic carbon-monoxide dehydrogenase medium subunit
MKPARFQYYDPETVDEVLRLLAEHGEEAKILAGGQSLVPLMNFRLARPSHLIDINRVDALAYLKPEDGVLRIGALTRQRAVEKSELVRRRNPLIVEASAHIGHPAIRNRGSVGGSLANADPAAEWPALALAMDATMIVRSAHSERAVPAAEFFMTYLTTCMAPDEMLAEVRIPGLPPGSGWSFLELSRRHGDFALVGVAIWLTANAGGVCTGGAIALTGVGAAPVRARRAEQRLLGGRLGEPLFQQVATAVSEELEPDSDLHASAEYRRRVGGVLTRRALAIAQTRLAQNGTRE